MNHRAAAVVGIALGACSGTQPPKSVATETRCPIGHKSDAVVGNGSPYIWLDAQAGEGNVTRGLFLLDTGTASTVVDRPFASKLGVLPSSCSFDGKLSIAGSMQGSSFGVNGAAAGSCVGVAFKNATVPQNGILGIDWLVENAYFIDLSIGSVVSWTSGEWEKCRSSLPSHLVLKIVPGPTSIQSDGANPAPACMFENNTFRKTKFLGCSIPYVQGRISSDARVVDAPLQLDTGREKGLLGDISVNRYVRDALVGKNAISNERCIDAAHTGAACEIFLYDARVGTTLDVGVGPISITSVEYRTSNKGEPYSNPAAAGEVGMSVLGRYQYVVIDPFDAEVLLLETPMTCTAPCTVQPPHS